MTEWQDISTAPRDGEHVFVFWRDRSGKPMITPARWRASRLNKHLYGWHVHELTDLDFELAVEPTHWMPLPEPPQELGNDDG